MVNKLTFPATENEVQSKVNELVDSKQDTLVSGTNIKTVGGASLLGSGNITLPTKVSDLTNDSGFITSITSMDVTTALGYTPYNSTNPSGYQANVIETVKVNGTALTPSSKAVDITVPTVNNATLTITQGGTTKGTFMANASSDVTIALDSGGTVDIDNSSITENSSDQLQTVGVIDSRSGNTIKTWTGTKAQYEAITTKDSNTLYNITDDTDMTLSMLNLLYPVGSIYIGTMNSCPLATLGIGTWQVVGTAIVTSVSSSVPVKGTGKVLGLASNLSSETYRHVVSIASGTGGGDLYTSPSTGGNYGNASNHIGVTTDETKSGIVGTATSTHITLNIFERTA